MAKVPFKLYSSRIKINRQTGSDNFYATWSLSSAQKKKKITKKVYKSKSKPKVKTTKRYPSVISGYIVKWYYTTVSSKNATWYLSKTITTSSGTRTTSHDLWTPPENAVKIKVKIIPVPKVYRTSSSGTSKWFSTEYTSKTDSDYDEYPSAPSIESFSITNKDNYSRLKFSVPKEVIEDSILNSMTVDSNVEVKLVDAQPDGEIYQLNI